MIYYLSSKTIRNKHNFIIVFLYTKENNKFGALKKLISIFVALTLLIFSTELQELLKLPLLFQHYYEHKAINEEITFVRYLADHYNSIPHTDNDEDRDNQLPFKSEDKNSVLTSLAIPLFNGFTIKSLITIMTSRLPVYDDDDIPHTSLGRIWQPPKYLIYSLRPQV